MRLFELFKLSDVYYCVRSLVQDWRFSLNFILILCLGLAALLYTFNIHHAFLKKPLNYTGDRDLFIIGTKVNAALQSEPLVTYDDYKNLKYKDSPFQDTGFYSSALSSAKIKNRQYLLKVSTVSDNLFELFEVLPIAGRFFKISRGVSGGENVAVVSEDVWNFALSSQKNMDNAYIEISGAQYRIIGVAPGKFKFPDSSDVWINKTLNSKSENIFIFGYLKKQFNAKSADFYIKDYFGSKSEFDIDPRENTEYLVSNIKDYFWGPKSKKVIYIQLLSAFLLFLLSVVNVCGMFITRQESRKQYLMIRRAVGSCRSGLTKLFVYECVALVFISAVAGYFLAIYLCSVGLEIIKLSEPETAFIWSTPKVELWSSTPIFIIVVLAIFISCLISYLKVGKREIYQSLKGSVGNSNTSKGRAFKRIIIFIEIYLTAFIVSVAAVLVMISFESNEAEYKLDFSGLYSFKINADDAEFRSHKERKIFLKNFLDKINSSGLNAGIFSRVPTENVFTGAVKKLGNNKVIEAKKITTSSGFTVPLNANLLYGRDFNATDTRGSDLVVIVSRSFAEEFWPDNQALAIGEKIQFVSRSGEISKEHTVIGVIQDVLFGKPFGASKNAPALFIHYLQRKDNVDMRILVKGELGLNLEKINTIKDGVDSRGLTYDFEPLKLGATRILGTQIFLKWLIISFGVCSVVIAFNGVYSLVLLDVQSRKKDIGVLKALGLTYGNTVSLVARPFVMTALVAILIGVSSSVLVGSIFISYFGISSSAYVIVYPFIGILILTIVAVALWLPIRRIFKLNTARTLSE